MKKIVFLVLCGLFAIGTQAQGLKTKYIQIKDVYHFQDEFNQYRVNSFMKVKNYLLRWKQIRVTC